MKYVVHGYRTQVISVEVEAGSPSEAMDKVSDGSTSERNIDVWDTNYEWHVAYENG